ncbi:MAG TPA: alpha/beta hydrolase [Solirubrobacteraceae bacterium]|jgi:pimeloyl-ACP methyl ester carboxylesterase
MPEVELNQGTIQYRDQGEGPVVVLVHGLLVNATVWERVIGGLSEHARVIAPDLPLGSHPTAMRGEADLSPLGLAALIADFLEALGLEEVTLVGNDTGGALCQLVCVWHPERIGRLVLINCDAFENFPPPAFKGVVRFLSRVPGAVAAVELSARLPAVRNASMKVAPLTLNPVPDELVKGWVAPLRDRGVRRDLVRVLRGIDPRYTLEAAERLRGFDRPALLVWGMRDKFFPVAEAERLAERLPDARLERIENARTFVQLDEPARVAELVGAFVSEPAEMA